MRIPNEIVYASKEFSSNGKLSAFAQIHSNRCGSTCSRYIKLRTRNYLGEKLKNTYGCVLFRTFLSNIEHVLIYVHHSDLVRLERFVNSERYIASTACNVQNLEKRHQSLTHEPQRFSTRPKCSCRASNKKHSGESSSLQRATVWPKMRKTSYVL